MTPSQPSPQSPASRRAAEAQARTLITKHASADQRLIGTTRRSLRKRLPTAHELVYEYTSWLVISYSPNEHGYLGGLAIRADAKGVKLYSNRGKGLPDPEKLRQGKAQTRWISVEGASTLTRPAVVRLIEGAIKGNPACSPALGRGRWSSVRPLPRSAVRSTSSGARPSGAAHSALGGA